MLHATTSALKYCLALGSCAVVALCTLYVTRPTAQSNASPIYGVTIPAGYRDWKLIAVNQLVTDKVDQLRAQLGNEIAIKAFEEGTIPFPDGTIIAALHWNRVPSEGNHKVLVGAFPGAQSFVVGSAANVQFMVKDSKKYAATGGWGFGHFAGGKPGDAAFPLPREGQSDRPCLYSLCTVMLKAGCPQRAIAHIQRTRCSGKPRTAYCSENATGDLETLRKSI